MKICALEESPLAHASKGIDTCVHCGFCLQACPTYLALEDENDSPRGRIVLMRSFLEGTIEPDDKAANTHISRCLGCRACETACPSGVPYGQLLEATRATIKEPLPLMARAILWTFARPWALKTSMFFARLFAATPIPSLLSRIQGKFGFSMAMLAAATNHLERGHYSPESSAELPKTAVLKGCVMEGLFTDTNRATERVLVKNGYDLVDAPGQRCCGALHAHSGDLETARRLARKNIDAFERSGAEFVAVNAAGCGAIMKEYNHLLHDDEQYAERAAAFASKVKDVSELLAAVGPLPGGPLPMRVTYDAPCHLQHAQRVVQGPLAVLAAIPELELVPLHDSDQCCGSAGIYNLIEPETSDLVLDAKLRNIQATGAQFVVTGNPGCLMQIGAGLIQSPVPIRSPNSRPRARVVHPVDLLDASYASL